jgi:hypothetical protein
MLGAGHFSIRRISSYILVAILGVIGPAATCRGEGVETAIATNIFGGLKPGQLREVKGIQLCWCPPGTFTMGSPSTDLERRPGEDQVEVTNSKALKARPNTARVRAKSRPGYPNQRNALSTLISQN